MADEVGDEMRVQTLVVVDVEKMLGEARLERGGCLTNVMQAAHVTSDHVHRVVRGGG